MKNRLSGFFASKSADGIDFNEMMQDLDYSIFWATPHNKHRSVYRLLNITYRIYCVNRMMLEK